MKLTSTGTGQEHKLILHWAGNTLHALARLEIGSTPMAGIDAQMIGEIFKDERKG